MPDQPVRRCTAEFGSIATALVPRYPQGMSLLERIVINSEIVHGRPAIRGTRMRVTDVLSLLAAGASEAEILEDYPYLAPDDIRACLEYAAVQADHAVLLAS